MVGYLVIQEVQMDQGHQIQEVLEQKHIRRQLLQLNTK